MAIHTASNGVRRPRISHQIRARRQRENQELAERSGDCAGFGQRAAATGPDEFWKRQHAVCSHFEVSAALRSWVRDIPGEVRAPTAQRSWAAPATGDPISAQRVTEAAAAATPRLVLRTLTPMRPASVSFSVRVPTVLRRRTSRLRGPGRGLRGDARLWPWSRSSTTRGEAERRGLATRSRVGVTSPQYPPVAYAMKP